MRLFFACIFILSGLAAIAQDESLRLLNVKERIEYYKRRQFPGPKTIFKDTLGTIVKGFNVMLPIYNGELYSGTDYYVSPAGQIVEIVFHKAKAGDVALNRRLFDLEEDYVRGSMELVKINCQQARAILADALIHEQENRKDDQVIDVEMDNANEATVVSLLDQCPLPTVANVGYDGIKAIFLVLLHARRKNQEKYFPVLKAFIERGDLRKGSLTLIEDKLLRAGGQKQRYGSQIIFFAQTGYFLFPIEGMDKVDIRRAEAGLPPLEEFLKKKEDFYGADIKR